jgi:hypothetical protein
MWSLSHSRDFALPWPLYAVVFYWFVQLSRFAEMLPTGAVRSTTVRWSLLQKDLLQRELRIETNAFLG